MASFSSTHQLVQKEKNYFFKLRLFEQSSVTVKYLMNNNWSLTFIFLLNLNLSYICTLNFCKHLHNGGCTLSTVASHQEGCRFENQLGLFAYGWQFFLMHVWVIQCLFTFPLQSKNICSILIAVSVPDKMKCKNTSNWSWKLLLMETLKNKTENDRAGCFQIIRSQMLLHCKTVHYCILSHFITDEKLC